jgi:sterol carrier protein 2
MEDWKLPVEEIKAVYASYVYGESCCGQRAFNEFARTGVPVVNVNNNCSSGSTALYLANNHVKATGQPALALGFEVMEKGLGGRYLEWPQPIAPYLAALYDIFPDGIPVNPRIQSGSSATLLMFEAVAQEHKLKYGTKLETFVKIAHKNHVHGAHNKKAAYPKELTMEEITNPKRNLTEHIYTAMASPTSNGSAVAIIVSEDYLKAHPHLIPNAIEIVGQSLTTDKGTDFGTTVSKTMGFEIAKEGAQQALGQAKKTIKDVDFIELHDCFAPNELATYEALGLCPVGDGAKFVDSIRWEQRSGGGKQAVMGNRWVINPSGGLESKGHPLGATGLGQCYEICSQLRNRVEPQRQIPSPKVALQHNLGIGSACVITVYEKPQNLTGNKL